MAAHNVTELLKLRNQQVEFCENLREILSKATALMHVALENDFLTHPQLIVYFYLWTVTDLIDESRQLNEQTLQVLRHNGNAVSQMDMAV